MSGAIAAVLFSCAGALLAQGSDVLKAARMFDSTSGQIVTPGMVVVSNGVIQSVGGDAITSGATVIDLGDATLLPGFIDAHTHLSDEFNPDYNGNSLLSLQRPISEKGDPRLPRTRASQLWMGSLRCAFSDRRTLSISGCASPSTPDMVRARGCWCRYTRSGPLAGIAMTARAFVLDCSAMRPGLRKVSSIRPIRRVTRCASTSNTGRT